MVSGDEMVSMICEMVATSPTTIPVSLMNHSPEFAGQIVISVVQHCVRNNCPIRFVHMNPELASILQFKEGQTLTPESTATLICEDCLGRQVKFVRASN